MEKALAVKRQSRKDWAFVKELAESLQIRNHAALGLVDRCVRAAPVEPTPGPDDRRQVRVSLTPKREMLLARLSTRNRRELRTLRQALTATFLEEMDRAG